MQTNYAPNTDNVTSYAGEVRMRNITLAFLLACGVASPVQAAQRFEYVQVVAQTELMYLPQLNSASEAEIGQNIVQAASKTVTPAIRVTDEIYQEWSAPNIVKVRILPSTLFLAGTDPNGSYYRAGIGNIELSYMGNGLPPEDNEGGIFVPNQSLAETQIYWKEGPTYGTMTPHPGIKYVNTLVEEWNTNSFKRELVYQGVSQNTVSIRYREFIKDMARPAFTEDLKYDLSQGKLIGYKGARFQIIKANNLGIRYKVLKPLD